MNIVKRAVKRMKNYAKSHRSLKSSVPKLNRGSGENSIFHLSSTTFKINYSEKFLWEYGYEYENIITLSKYICGAEKIEFNLV